MLAFKLDSQGISGILTRSGINIPAITLPPGGVTRSKPVELVGFNRIVSRTTAFRTGS